MKFNNFEVNCENDSGSKSNHEVFSIADSSTTEFNSEGDRKTSIAESDLYQVLALDEGGFNFSEGKEVYLRGIESNQYDLYLIDEFVRAVVKYKSMGYEVKVNRHGAYSVRGLLLSKYVGYMSSFLSIYRCKSSHIRYSEHIELFFLAVKAIGLECVDFGKPLWISNPNSKPNYVLFNELIQWLRDGASNSTFLERVRIREKKSIQRYDSMSRYAVYLLKKYKRLLVLRVNFYYLKEFVGAISEEEARRDINRLLRNRRHNGSVFDDMVGYICRIEWAPDTRYHFHVMFFLDGDKARKHVYRADEIGKYWANSITKGKGRFHNSNRDIFKFPWCGVGMIHFSSQVEIDNLQKAISYLTKKEQEILANALGHDRNLMRGNIDLK
jgi:hypothetical protein